MVQNQVISLYQNEKSLNLKINNVSDSNFTTLKKIFLQNNLKGLLFDVSSELNSDTLIFNLSTAMNDHGAYDPGVRTPTFQLNAITGISASNIAHELVHSIQIKQGYPTIKKIYKDKRNEVLKELGSNLLHIPLTKILEERGFNLEDYLMPFLKKMNDVLSARSKEGETKLIFYRAHYEATMYLRLQYEAKFLDDESRNFYVELYKKKAPIAFTLATKLIGKISKYNLDNPTEYTEVLYECIKLLNNEDLSKYYSTYISNCYIDYLRYMRNTYKYLK